MDRCDASALVDLQMHWDEAYDIRVHGRTWSARFHGSAEDLRASSASELRELIRADYTCRTKARAASAVAADAAAGVVDEEDDEDEDGFGYGARFGYGYGGCSGRGGSISASEPGATLDTEPSSAPSPGADTAHLDSAPQPETALHPDSASGPDTGSGPDTASEPGHGGEAGQGSGRSQEPGTASFAGIRGERMST